jgi:hypothetical protein
MADIAATLEVDRLIYGTVLRAGEEVQLALFNFYAVTGHVESSIEHKVRAAELQEPALDATIGTLLRRLAGEKVAGMLRITGDTPGAKVSLDGEDMGALDVRGELLLTEVAAGPHQVVVEAPSGRKEQSVNVVEGTTATVRVVLRAPATLRISKEEQTEDFEQPGPRRGRWRRPVGWTAVGLAGAFAVGTVITWVGLDQINKDPDLRAYRGLYTRPGQENGTADVCREAKDHTQEIKNASADRIALEGSARDLCNRADTLELLQYVFIGAAVASGGVGAYLLLTTPKDNGPKVSFRPRIRGHEASISATVRF